MMPPALPVPVINAGDGGHQHPTQTLTDLLTIRSLKGRLGNLTIGLCGDLKFGRTVHSLIHALVRYENVRFVLISPEELRLPSYIRKDVLDKNNIPYKEVINLEEAMPELDLLYMTRVQKERFFNEEDYVRMKDFYILDAAKMSLAKEDMLVLHPLPRVNEISVEVDKDPRAAYLKQVQYGVYVRMALILTLLEIKVTTAERVYHGKQYIKCQQYLRRICIRPYSGRKKHGYLSLPSPGQVGLLCRNHQKCKKQQNGKERTMKIECPIDIIDLDILGFIDQQYHNKYHPE